MNRPVTLTTTYKSATCQDCDRTWSGDLAHKESAEHAIERLHLVHMHSGLRATAEEAE